ncbi:MAG: GNAT family N-acetyltransferase [Methanoregula sp.]
MSHVPVLLQALESLHQPGPSTPAWSPAVDVPVKNSRIQKWNDAGETYGMYLSQYGVKRNLAWNLAIAGTACATLIANFWGLTAGITMVIPHLLYIPVVLAAYRYPRWGLYLSALIGGIYFVIAFLLVGNDPFIVFEIFIRTLVIILIGGLIAFLTLRLREHENLYRGLFDHSEAGSILLTDNGTGPVIEDVNWKATYILKMKQSALKGKPLTVFSSGDLVQEMFSHIHQNGAVFTREAIFTPVHGVPVNVLVSLAALHRERFIFTFVDITSLVRTEEALRAANEKLNLLSRISTDYLTHTADRISTTVDDGVARCTHPASMSLFKKIQNLVQVLTRQLQIAQSYKDLGTSSPEWIPVQRVLEGVRFLEAGSIVSIRFWTQRLEIFADPLFKRVLSHIAGNAIRHGETIQNLVVSYQETADGLDLFFEDDGIGVPLEKKQQIFNYDAGEHAGIGLFICRQIIAVTGMTLSEIGTKGTGARFVIHIPQKGYRIDTARENPPVPEHTIDTAEPLQRGVRHTTGAMVRELSAPEFTIADTLWTGYHPTKGDPLMDRIFMAFSDGNAVSVARCRKHPDGYEVDGVYTPVEYRGHGFAHAVVWGLVEACGHDTLYMHSIKDLTGFYSKHGFVPIDEHELPPTIQERYAWAQGEMEGADVCPMKRTPVPGRGIPVPDTVLRS